MARFGPKLVGSPRSWGFVIASNVSGRTGSLFGAGGYFLTSDVEVSGPSVSYVRAGTSGGRVEGHFCPTCGSTVYWFPEKFQGMIGVAVGAFADPAFPAPSWSVWEQSRHEWLDFGHDMRRLPRGIGA